MYDKNKEDKLLSTRTLKYIQSVLVPKLEQNFIEDMFDSLPPYGRHALSSQQPYHEALDEEEDIEELCLQLDN